MRDRGLLAVVAIPIALLTACSGGKAASPGEAASATPPVVSTPALGTSPASATTGGSARDVSFISDESGWVLSGGQLLSTNDGGDTWTVIGPAPRAVSNLRFASLTDGYAWWNNGPLWLTSDGGRSWRRADLPRMVYLEVGAGVAWAITGPLPGPQLWRSPLGSTSWKHLGYGPGRDATLDVHGSTAYVTGQQGAGPDAPIISVWTTSTSSARNEQAPCNRLHRLSPFTPLGVSTDGVVLMVCDVEDGTHTEQVAFASYDEARTWTRLSGPPEAATDVTATRGGIFSWATKILRLHDGAWHTELAVEHGGFKTVGFITDEFGVALAKNGRLYRTTDGGDTWTFTPV
jgi:hypothetical protein